MQLFSADAKVFLRKFLISFLPLKTVFSIANQPKISPNLIFFSPKNGSLYNFYIMTLKNKPGLGQDY